MVKHMLSYVYNTFYVFCVSLTAAFRCYCVLCNVCVHRWAYVCDSSSSIVGTDSAVNRCIRTSPAVVRDVWETATLSHFCRESPSIASTPSLPASCLKSLALHPHLFLLQIQLLVTIWTEILVTSSRAFPLPKRMPGIWAPFNPSHALES